MSFDFTEVAKGRVGFDALPENVVRLTAKGVTFGESVSRHYNYTRGKSASGNEMVKIGIAYDSRNQAIKLTSDPEGFNFSINGNGTAQVGMPSKLRRAAMPTGDYKLVEPNVYQLVK